MLNYSNSASVCLVIAVAMLEGRSECVVTGAQQSRCQTVGGVVRARELPEASGVAASRRTPGIFWAHNDSGDPLIFALNEKGVVTGRIRVAGAKVDDWEDLAVGPCPQKWCLYIADIGDNDGNRHHISIYRVAEPLPQDTATKPAEVFHAMYPDGSHDAESLFVTPDSDVFIMTKGDPGPVALYRFPRPLRPSGAMPLERVGNRLGGSNVDEADRPTAADASQDGQWVAVRTTKRVAFYRAADLAKARFNEVFRVDVNSLNEPRGEGVAFASGGSLILVGEGGLSGGGTFARLQCELKQ